MKRFVAFLRRNEINLGSITALLSAIGWLGTFVGLALADAASLAGLPAWAVAGLSFASLAALWAGRWGADIARKLQVFKPVPVPVESTTTPATVVVPPRADRIELRIDGEKIAESIGGAEVDEDPIVPEGLVPEADDGMPDIDPPPAGVHIYPSDFEPDEETVARIAEAAGEYFGAEADTGGADS